MRERSRAPLRVCGLFLLAVAWSQALWPAEVARPKLIVLLVAEHFRPEYLERYRASFGAGGFNRLLKSGAVFRQCRYEYLATFPASGAAVLATGAYPDRNGIVAEYWYDRRARRVVSAVEDAEQTLVGAADPRGPAPSPVRLIGTTLADQLRLATSGRFRTISISLRAATAVPLGGKRPSGCYWLDDAGRFVTSSYYTKELPTWVADFNRLHSPFRFRGWAWRALEAKESAPPLRTIAGDGTEDSSSFLASYRASPPALEDQFAFVRAALEAEQLGRRGATDLLAVSLSPLYSLGVEVGASSPLMRDLVVRLDRQLDELFGTLDSTLGPGNFWVAFTATQGLPEAPDLLQPEGIRAGRVDSEQVAATVNARLTAMLGKDSHVEKYVYPSLYLRRPRDRDPKTERAADMARAAGEAALAVSGVAAYFAVDSAGGAVPPESASLFARSIYGDRSGDVLLAYEPYFTERHSGDRGVSAGSFYNYATHVPLVLYGAPFRAQTLDRPVSPADLAPTLAVALGISPPSSAVGRFLEEALQER